MISYWSRWVIAEQIWLAKVAVNASGWQMQQDCHQNLLFVVGQQHTAQSPSTAHQAICMPREGPAVR